MKPFFTLLAIFPWVSTLPAGAQSSTIDTTHRYAHSANAGWMDLRPSKADGVWVADTCLAGYTYAANVGWIHFGSGTPNNGHSYSQESATDYGVNLDTLGRLTGYAYGANIGWIQFEQTHGQPKINLLTGEFSGYAYSANLGWISLETTASTLVTQSIYRPDSDNDGIADPWEMLHFGSLATATAITDSDGDGATDAAEYLAGTSPTDRASLLRIDSYKFNSDRSRMNLSFTVEPNRLYRIEYDEDLDGSWTDSALGTFAPGVDPIQGMTLQNLTVVPRRFFRVVAVNPL